MKVDLASWKWFPFFPHYQSITTDNYIVWVLGLRRLGFPSFGHSDFSLFLALALAFLDITNKFSDASLRLETL